jgi:UPF0716 protein FxsA
MRFIVLAIVLAFPAIDLLATVRFARWTGIPVWIWLLLSTSAGFVLLRNERVAFRANTAAAMHGEQFALRGLFDSGRKVLAGVLFLLPGVISDVMALVLLALPLNVGHGLEPQGAHPYRRGRQRAFDGRPPQRQL